MRTLSLRSGDGVTEARFVPEANLLCCSLRHDGRERLHQGDGVARYAEHGKTMGVPLLHPWANRLAGLRYAAAGKQVTLPDGDRRIPRDPAGLPIHGVLPELLRWEVQRCAGGSLEARLDWSTPELLELFPFEHELRVLATVTPGALALETVLRATGSDPVPVSFGYHPYLRLPEIPREHWQVELGAENRLILDERMLPTGAREPLYPRSFPLEGVSLDDGYDGIREGARFRAAAAGHEVTVCLRRGYPFAQAYAPPGQGFVCFEPMTAPANALCSGDGLSLVAAGGEYRALFSLAVR